MSTTSVIAADIDDPVEALDRSDLDQQRHPSLAAAPGQPEVGGSRCGRAVGGGDDLHGGMGPADPSWSGWETPGDVWEIFRGAHYVGWGFLGGVYDPASEVVSLSGHGDVAGPGGHAEQDARSFGIVQPVLPGPSDSRTYPAADRAAVGRNRHLRGGRAGRPAGRRRRRRDRSVLGSSRSWLAGRRPMGPCRRRPGHDVRHLCADRHARRQWTRCGWLVGFGIVMQPLVPLPSRC